MLKLTIVAAALAILGSALAWQQTPDTIAHATSSPSETKSSPAASGVTYASLLHEIDDRVDSLQARADKRPQDWLIRMHLGVAILDRAGLTNRVEDFERVQAVLDEAFAIAREGSGPLLLAARFNFSIHRLDVAEDYLDRMDRRAIQKADERLAARLLRAQIAFQRGQYEDAFAGLSDVAGVMPAIATAELALYHAKTGEADRADVLLEQAFAGTSAKDARRRAWTKLQRGLVAMERGAYLPALERLAEAEAELPGWWLVQEHIAEVYDRLGQHRRAIEIYDALVRHGGLPQHMDALASAYRHAGEPEKAEPVIERARSLWDEQLERFPESAMGHGLAHHLQYGPAVRALELAEANYAARPGGDAQVALARAYLAAGKITDALAVAQRALATPYRTAALHHVAAQAHAALGETTAAEEQLALGKAKNPSYDGQDHTH